jgi:hypothetical protein
MMSTANRLSGSQAPGAAEQRALERISRRTESSIAYHRENPQRIPQRLDELDAEWDLERTLAAAASGTTLASLLFTVLRGGRWLLLGLGVQGLVMQHALRGRCAPSDLLRNLGVRTRQEIEHERRELQTLLDDAGGPDEGETGDHEDSERERRGRREREPAGAEGGPQS